MSKRDKMTTTGHHYVKQKLEREKYTRMTFGEKLEDIQTWREYYLLNEIARLKTRLGEGPERVTIACRSTREKSNSKEENHPMYSSYRP